MDARVVLGAQQRRVDGLDSPLHLARRGHDLVAQVNEGVARAVSKKLAEVVLMVGQPARLYGRQPFGKPVTVGHVRAQISGLRGPLAAVLGGVPNKAGLGLAHAGLSRTPLRREPGGDGGRALVDRVERARAAHGREARLERGAILLANGVVAGGVQVLEHVRQPALREGGLGHGGGRLLQRCLERAVRNASSLLGRDCPAQVAVGVHQRGEFTLAPLQDVLGMSSIDALVRAVENLLQHVATLRHGVTLGLRTVQVRARRLEGRARLTEPLKQQLHLGGVVPTEHPRARIVHRTPVVLLVATRPALVQARARHATLHAVQVTRRIHAGDVVVAADAPVQIVLEPTRRDGHLVHQRARVARARRRDTLSRDRLDHQAYAQMPRVHVAAHGGEHVVAHQQRGGQRCEHAFDGSAPLGVRLTNLDELAAKRQRLLRDPQPLGELRAHAQQAAVDVGLPPAQFGDLRLEVGHLAPGLGVGVVDLVVRRGRRGRVELSARRDHQFGILGGRGGHGDPRARQASLEPRALRGHARDVFARLLDAGTQMRRIAAAGLQHARLRGLPFLARVVGLAPGGIGRLGGGGVRHVGIVQRLGRQLTLEPRGEGLHQATQALGLALLGDG